jgi:hypothetical protein
MGALKDRASGERNEGAHVYVSRQLAPPRPAQPRPAPPRPAPPNPGPHTLRFEALPRRHLTR